jgi:alkylation response protein AidB-like acyl-CoA dehydrogenase
MAEVAVRNIDGVLAEVRELAKTLIAPGAAEIDRESRFPEEQLSALGRAGALGLLVPAEQGGAGAGLVALTGDSGDAGALVSLMEAKNLCTDVAARVTQAALEVCGGQGYTPALPIERHLRDARAGAVMAPTNGVLRTWSAKAIAGLPVP